MPWHTSLLSTYQPFSTATNSCIDNNDSVLHDTYTDHNNDMYIIIDVHTSRPTRAQLYYTIESGDFNGELFAPAQSIRNSEDRLMKKKAIIVSACFLQYKWLNQTVVHIMFEYSKTINKFQKRYLRCFHNSKNNKKYDFS